MPGYKQYEPPPPDQRNRPTLISRRGLGRVGFAGGSLRQQAVGDSTAEHVAVGTAPGPFPPLRAGSGGRPRRGPWIEHGRC